MDSFEFNKIAGAVLLALLVGMVINEVNNIVNHEPELEQQAYVVEGVELAAAGAAEEEVEPPFAVFLAQGSAEQGERQFRKCMSCHTIAEGAGNRTGPNLYNTMGADIATHADFNYSDALLALEGSWTYEKMDAWLENPREFAPGNKMAYGGIRDNQDRADLILYLAQNSVNPPPLPEPPAPEVEEAPEATDEAAEAAEAAAEEGMQGAADEAVAEGGEAEDAAPEQAMPEQAEESEPADSME